MTYVNTATLRLAHGYALYLFLTLGVLMVLLLAHAVKEPEHQRLATLHMIALPLLLPLTLSATAVALLGLLQ